MDGVDHRQKASGTDDDSDLMDQLELFAESRQEYDRYTLLLDKAEKHRQNVMPEVYEKVKQEYQEKITALEKNFSRTEGLLRDNLRAFQTERDDLDKNLKEKTLRLEEIKFRVHLGEYAQEQMLEELSDLEDTLFKGAADLERLEEILSKYSMAGLIQENVGDHGDKGPATGEDSAGRDPEDYITADESDADPTALEGAGEQRADTSPEKSGQQAPGFTVVAEDSETGDEEDCPVIHCPESLSLETSGEETPDGERSDIQANHHQAANEYVAGYLVAVEGSRKGDRFPLISSNITLGSSPGIDIRLTDSGVSNFHARVLYKDRKHYLENLDPMGRCYVNGVQADLIELKDGDVLRLGETKIQIEYVPSTDNTSH